MASIATLSILFTILFIIIPLRADAVGTAADAMCNPVIPQCPCGQVPNPKGGCMGGANMFMCPCMDSTNSFTTTGVCVAANKCQAQGTSGKDGFGLDKVAQMLGGLMQQLMQAAKGGGDSGSGSGSSMTGTTGCTTYTQVSSPTSNPCEYYVPSVSASLDGTTGTSNLSDLLNQIDTTSNTGTTNTNTDTSGTTNTNSNVSNTLGQVNATTNQTQNVVPATTTSNVVSTTTASNPFTLVPGVRGDIQLLSGGATFVAGTRDEAKNTEIAGFYGAATTLGEQPTGLVARLCQSRPWADNFLSAIISPSFFDSLCVWRGYKVGETVAVQPQVTVTQTKPQPVQPAKTVTPATTTPTQNVPAKVDVWAVPASVPLGSRTSVFWNTQGVTNCTVSSPDGSFSQTTLSGGASTVPLTGATTYTISCLDASGAPVTDYVTVTLSI